MRYFWIVPPRGKHRSYRILSKTGNMISTIVDDRLIVVNKMFKENVIDGQYALEQTNKILEELKASERPVRGTEKYLGVNVDIIDKYFKEKYESRDISLESLNATKSSFKRAAALLDELTFTTATRDEIQKLILKLPFKKRPHIVLSFNLMFKFLKRSERFDVGQNREVGVVKHLTLEEIKQVLPNIENTLVRFLAASAFASGCRVGELFSLSLYNDVNKVLTVRSQIDREHKERPPKTFRARTTVVIQELEEHVKEWMNISKENRLAIRTLRLSKILKEACQKTFPNNKDKWCHFYDLRHSYAIHFLSLGVSIDLIAAAIGNTPEVCRKHYTGYVLYDGGVFLMNHIQQNKKG